MGHDLDGLMSSSLGQPMAQIFLNSFGQNGTLIMWSFIILTQYMMGSSMVCFLLCSPIASPSLGQLLIMLLIIFVDARCIAPVLRLVCLSPYYI
jgi:hypothetical protein